MPDVERPPLAHAHAEGIDTSVGLETFWRVSSLYGPSDDPKWTPGEDDDPVEFGVLLQPDSVGFVDEDVLEHIVQFEEAREELNESLAFLDERDAIEVTRDGVRYDTGLQADEFVHLGDRR